jgi:hypothetical protein
LPWAEGEDAPRPICLLRDRFGARAAIPLSSGATFLRGDADGDRDVTISDPIGILFHLFRGEVLACPAAADANGDRTADLADPVYLLRFLFLGGPPPPPPFPVPGEDPQS